MIGRRSLLAGVAAGGVMAMLGQASRGSAGSAPETFEVVHSDPEWRRLLTPAQYQILRRAGAEAPGSSPLDHLFRKGVYDCAGCDLELFRSDAKYDSGAGWPSFWRPVDGAVRTSTDTSLFMVRTEVHCRRCGGHLGHVFNDGPRPTGLRYCMNGAAMTFKPA
jgi:peptide-methionine (R)-S-oxide reductase